jgi:maltooligosyltrehalose trehalohydrolase
MGQEWAATTPFLYFTDHAGELGEAVERGRREEFARFASFAEQIPSPQDPETFAKSRLEWDEADREPHHRVRQLYRDAIAFRRQRLVHPLEAAPAGDGAAHALDADTVALERIGTDGRRYVCICRLRGEGAVRYLPDPPMAADACTIILSTEDAAYVEQPQPIRLSAAPAGVELAFDRPGAVILAG